MAADLTQFLRTHINLIRLERFTEEVVARNAGNGRPFQISEDFLCRINGIASDGLAENKNPGQIRRVNVTITNTPHQPPSWETVGDLVREFCDIINSQWHDLNLVQLGAYALWRVNWVHPFENGNGRTARQLAYIILCVKSGGMLPGRNTIIAQIKDNRPAYTHALRLADAGDMGPLEQMITEYLKVQLRDGLGH